MKISHIKLRTKIISGMGIPLFLLIVMGVMGITITRSYIKISKSLGHTHSVIRDSVEIEKLALDMETGARGYLLSGEDDFFEPYVKGEEKLYEKISATREKVSDDPEQVRRLDRIREILRQWQTNAVEPATAIRQEIGDSEAMNGKTMDDLAKFIIQGRGKKYFDDFRQAANDFVKQEQVLMAELEKENNNMAKQMTWLMIGGMIVCMFLTVCFGFFIIRGITRPISQVVEVANAIAQGDMTRRLSVEARDEIGDLSAAMNQSSEDLASMLVRIRENSENLAGASDGLSSVSAQLASSSEETSVGISTMASAAEEMSANSHSVSSTAEQMSAIMNSIASAVEEMTVSVSNITQNAKQGSDISRKAIEMSDAATKTINTLGQAAAEIGEVTEVIRQIAQQTNLLALNATIEAASAGDAGKGFAVVANEIKELASQSGRSAEDITKRIRGVQASSEETIRAIGDVSGIISQISESSAVITQSVEQQSAASNEISSSIQQANEGVGNIAVSIAEIAKGSNDMAENASMAAKSVNEISASAQQIKTSSEDLAKVAAQMQEMVARFKINRGY